MVTTKKKTIINIRGGLNLNKDLCKHYILNDLQKDIFKKFISKSLVNLIFPSNSKHI